MTYVPDESERRVIAWLDGRPFGWPGNPTFWHRAKAAWVMLWHADAAMHGIFKILAIKIKQGAHRHD
jgi:hypothetical protein